MKGLSDVGQTLDFVVGRGPDANLDFRCAKNEPIVRGVLATSSILLNFHDDSGIFQLLLIKVAATLSWRNPSASGGRRAPDCAIPVGAEGV
jgi:hypothetical protein